MSAHDQDTPHAPDAEGQSSASHTPGAIKRRAGWVMAGIGLALIVALAAGVIPRSGAQASAQGTQTSTHDAVATANRQWASATCTNLLAWRTALTRDATSRDLGFGVPARIQDAIGATSRMLKRLDALGLPPAAQGGKARADAERLRSQVESRINDLQRAAARVQSGDLSALSTLIDDLRSDKALGAQMSGELRHFVTADLGLSLAGTPACRELVGIPN